MELKISQAPRADENKWQVSSPYRSWLIDHFWDCDWPFTLITTFFTKVTTHSFPYEVPLTCQISTTRRDAITQCYLLLAGYIPHHHQRSQLMTLYYPCCFQDPHWLWVLKRTPHYLLYIDCKFPRRSAVSCDGAYSTTPANHDSTNNNVRKTAQGNQPLHNVYINYMDIWLCLKKEVLAAINHTMIIRKADKT